jgi:hypothetical protein
MSLREEVQLKEHAKLRSCLDNALPTVELLISQGTNCCCAYLYCCHLARTVDFSMRNHYSNKEYVLLEL